MKLEQSPDEPTAVTVPAGQAMHGVVGSESWSVRPTVQLYDTHAPVAPTGAYEPLRQLTHAVPTLLSWSDEPAAHDVHTRSVDVVGGVSVDPIAHCGVTGLHFSWFTPSWKVLLRAHGAQALFEVGVGALV